MRVPVITLADQIAARLLAAFDRGLVFAPPTSAPNDGVMIRTLSGASLQVVVSVHRLRDDPSALLCGTPATVVVGLCLDLHADVRPRRESVALRLLRPASGPLRDLLDRLFLRTAPETVSDEVAADAHAILDVLAPRLLTAGTPEPDRCPDPPPADRDIAATPAAEAACDVDFGL